MAERLTDRPFRAGATAGNAAGTRAGTLGTAIVILTLLLTITTGYVFAATNNPLNTTLTTADDTRSPGLQTEPCTERGFSFLSDDMDTVLTSFRTVIDLPDTRRPLLIRSDSAGRFDHVTFDPALDNSNYRWDWKKDPLPDWALGPFTRPENAQPIITPNPKSTFDDPMHGKSVHWEATHTFNPAAVVKDGLVFVLYRAEDDNGAGIGGYTSRLGLAVSPDGVHFQRMPMPVLFPANDDQKGREWEGGCEDPRCVELEDGSYALFYTQYHRMKGEPTHVDLGMAISRDLIHWTKLGPVTGVDADGRSVTPSKSASPVCALKGGRLVATKINGRYWLYYGEGTIHLMSSPDLRTWRPEPAVALPPRPGKFDSDLAECGPPAILTPKGIVLLYNGKNATGDSTDPALKPGVYSNGQALFDANDPTKLLSRTDEPFFKPELPWEATGQYAAGTTFIEGLVAFHGKWMLYYGCADSNVGVATADMKEGNW